jgi:hypothetical protein
MPPPNPSETDMAVYLARAGFELTPDQIAEYAQAYGYVLEMSTRLRGGRSYTAEPAHMFSFPVDTATTEVSI